MDSNEHTADRSLVWLVTPTATVNLGLVIYGVRTR